MRKEVSNTLVNRKGPVESGDRCPVITGSVTTMKRSLRQRFLGSFADLHLLDLTLSEAESMAWDTTFPHLFFPVLAEEKISKALAWAERQRALRACTSEFCFAA